MIVSPDTGSGQRQRSFTSFYPVATGCLSLIALVVTYLLANSSYDMATKTRAFSGVIATFLVLCVSIYFWQSRQIVSDETVVTDEDPRIDRNLTALDDAIEFFAGSLNSSDTFRLVSSRVKDLVPYRTMALNVLDENRERFFVADADGPDADFRIGRFAELTEGVTGRSYFTQIVEIDHGAASSRPGIAIPLRKEAEVFAVLQMDFEMSCDLNQFDPLLLDAIGTRAAPLISSAISYERSRANALTDATTDLPNERAFYLVLENQVAESSRKGAARPLTILALDVRSFDDINNRFGHTAGDRILTFVAQAIKDNLRQMDFFARATADEFLVVLPTASKQISHDVIARIHTGFFGRKLKITDEESIEVELNVGWAAYGTDGDTPETLLTVARERKEQAKSVAPNKVLWFPTEFAN
jgi:diguanylate cyclase (GGDEF)-like protein